MQNKGDPYHNLDGITLVTGQFAISGLSGTYTYNNMGDCVDEAT